MPIYGYVRVSTLAQADEGESLAVQRRKIEGRAAENGWTVERCFVERGVSGGKPFAERKQGAELLAVLKPHDVVIASKLDRMFRSASDALTVMESFKARQIGLWLLDLGGDVTGNGISAMVFTILSAVAQFERERIAERIRDVKADQRRRGRHLGGSLPFGYLKNDDGELVPDPAKAEAVRLIRELHAEGKGLRTIANAVYDHFRFKLSHMAVQGVVQRAATTTQE